MNIETYFCILIIIAFNYVVYYPTIWFGLVMDDCQWWDQRRKDGLTPILKINSYGMFRHILDQRLYSGTTFGTNTKVEHAFTLALHTCICVLLYVVFGMSWTSFGAAMLYACNPINNQTAIWLNGRRYAINIILVLLMMLCPLISPVLYIFTGLLQVTAIFSPIALMNKSPWFLLLIPLFLVLGWKQIMGKVAGRSEIMAQGDLKTFKPTRLIMIVKTFGFFFFKMLIPGVCAMQYPTRFYWGLTAKGNKDAYAINLDFWQGVAALVINVGIIALVPLHARFYAIFMGLAILQWSAVLPVTQILSDRYCSLPNVFMMFFVAYFAHLAGPFYIPILVLLVVYYLVCLFVVMPMYKDLMAYYNYHVQYFPAIPWPRDLLISDLLGEGKIEGAQAYAFDGLKHNQNEYSLLMWGAIFSFMRHDFKNAEVFLDQAEKNMQLGREERQTKEIADMRKNIRIVKPVPGYSPRKIK